MLDGHVLVLNRLFQAVQITSVRRALTLLYKGQVRAVETALERELFAQAHRRFGLEIPELVRGAALNRQRRPLPSRPVALRPKQ